MYSLRRHSVKKRRPPALRLAGICLLAAVSFAASQIDPSEAWLKSEDPCFQFKQLKNVDNVKCIPVKVELLWEAEERYRRHSPSLGTDRVRLTMTDEFTAYLAIFFNRQDRSLMDHITIVGPAPCCPGRVSSVLQEVDCRVLVCQWGGKNCRPFTIKDANLFTVIPGDDPVFVFSWERTGKKGQGSVEIQSASVFISDEVVKEPYTKSPGILESRDGGTFNILAEGKDAFDRDDIIELLELGAVEKRIPFRKDLPLSEINEFYTAEGAVTVALEYWEEEETWSVTVEGWELDRTQSPIANPALKAPGYLPIGVENEWKLEADFVLKKLKGWRTFKEGTVRRAVIKPKIKFEHWDLYNCNTIDCPGKDSLSGITGAFLQGQVLGDTVSLKWPIFNPETCVNCTPRKKDLGKKVYQQTFESPEFLSKISGEVLPLKNGYSVEKKVSDWMSYRITLRRIK